MAPYYGLLGAYVFRCKGIEPMLTLETELYECRPYIFIFLFLLVPTNFTLKSVKRSLKMTKLQIRAVLALLFVVCVASFLFLESYSTKFGGVKDPTTKTRELDERKHLMFKDIVIRKEALNQSENRTHSKSDHHDTIIEKGNAGSLNVSVKDKKSIPKPKLDDAQPVDSIHNSRHACSRFKNLVPEPKDEVFQPIVGSDSYAFSAFAISQTSLRMVFVYKKTDNAGLFLCQYNVRSARSNTLYEILDTVHGKVQRISDDHGREYTAAFLNCPLPANASVLPALLVSIRYGNNCQNVTSNLLPVQRQPRQESWEFTVCVAPFHHNYGKAEDLMEMVELNRILGAKQFYFYNASSSPLVAKVLGYYQRRGLANIIQWHMPVIQHMNNITKTRELSIHYFGQNAAINDCLYRNRKRSKYVVITDIDEFIIPHNPNVTTWSQLVTNRLAFNPRAAYFQVRMSYYRKEWKSSENTFPFLDKAKVYNSIPLQNVQREERLFPYKIRTKYIANPLLVDEGGIHYVYRVRGDRTDLVPISEAIVHHYRKQADPNKPSLRIFDDIVVRRYGAPLVQALDKARKELGMTVV